MINLKSLGLVGLVALSACCYKPKQRLTSTKNEEDYLVCKIPDKYDDRLKGELTTLLCFDGNKDGKIDEVVVINRHVGTFANTVRNITHLIAEDIIYPIYVNEGILPGKLNPEYASSLDATCRANRKF